VIKKYLQKVFKKISYSFFLGIYGKIENIIKNSNDDRIQEKKIVEKELKYKVYIISKGRLYTDRIHDTAAILDNKIIEGPSFQLRQIDNCIYNSKIEDNIVFEKGTPRKLKKLNGTVLSLLTGGAGNNNYWHWLFDVLPRFGMYNKFHSFEEINYFFNTALINLYNYYNDGMNILVEADLLSEKEIGKFRPLENAISLADEIILINKKFFLRLCMPHSGYEKINPLFLNIKNANGSTINNFHKFKVILNKDVYYKGIEVSSRNVDFDQSKILIASTRREMEDFINLKSWIKQKLDYIKSKYIS